MSKTKITRQFIKTTIGFGAVTAALAISAPAFASSDTVSTTNTTSNTADVRVGTYLHQEGGYRHAAKANANNITGTFIVPKVQCVGNDTSYVGVRATSHQFGGTRITCVGTKPAKYTAVYANQDGFIKPLDNNPKYFGVKAGDKMLVTLRKTEPDVAQVQLLNWGNWAESRFVGSSLGNQYGAWGVWNNVGTPPAITKVVFTGTSVNGDKKKLKSDRIPFDVYVTTAGGANFTVLAPTDDDATLARKAESSINGGVKVEKKKSFGGGDGTAITVLGNATTVQPKANKLKTSLPVVKINVCTKGLVYGLTTEVDKVWTRSYCNNGVVSYTAQVGAKHLVLSHIAYLSVLNGYVSLNADPGFATTAVVYRTGEKASTKHNFTLTGEVGGNTSLEVGGNTSLKFGWVQLPVQGTLVKDGKFNAKLVTPNLLQLGTTK